MAKQEGDKAEYNCMFGLRAILGSSVVIADYQGLNFLASQLSTVKVCDCDQLGYISHQSWPIRL